MHAVLAGTRRSTARRHVFVIKNMHVCATHLSPQTLHLCMAGGSQHIQLPLKCLKCVGMSIGKSVRTTGRMGMAACILHGSLRDCCMRAWLLLHIFCATIPDIREGPYRALCAVCLHNHQSYRVNSRAIASATGLLSLL